MPKFVRAIPIEVPPNRKKEIFACNLDSVFIKKNAFWIKRKANFDVY